jgi:hypothetical protein
MKEIECKLEEVKPTCKYCRKRRHKKGRDSSGEVFLSRGKVSTVFQKLIYDSSDDSKCPSRQNVLFYKIFFSTKHLTYKTSSYTKRPTLQNVLLYKMSFYTKCPSLQNVLLCKMSLTTLFRNNCLMIIHSFPTHPTFSLFSTASLQ